MYCSYGSKQLKERIEAKLKEALLASLLNVVVGHYMVESVRKANEFNSEI